MRQNVLAAVACGLIVLGPGPLPAAVSTGASSRPLTCSDVPGAGTTMLLGPAWVDPWPGGPCGAAAGGSAR